ncbi:MAG: response regulator [Candidatus Staskawiczbacteria bacterium]|nr:response regulator [Candidatus Staskawiczbacteria bacterium]
MKTILLAEHDAFLINVYSSQLRKSGYSTIIALNGESAILRVKNINPDLLVLDAGLPNPPIDGGGLEVLKAIRQDLGLKNLKVVMLSDFEQQEYISKSKQFGVIKCFLKAENTAEDIVEGIKAILN